MPTTKRVTPSTPVTKAAAAQAQIADFIESLPKGYATTVGERGVRLSGGQRQRIGIARALYKQAPVLVFDEATSALDDATERALMETLDGLSRDLTIIMIAHRLSTVVDADCILVVRDGMVVERGTHNELLAESGEYARLWAMQDRGEDEQVGNPR